MTKNEEISEKRRVERRKEQMQGKSRDEERTERRREQRGKGAKRIIERGGAEVEKIADLRTWQREK